MSVVKNLDIQLIDEDAKTTTVKLDNPREDITKNQVISVFATAISNNWLLSNYGNPVKAIGQVQLSTSEKILLEGDPIYVTPERATLRPTPSTPSTQTFSVANGTIQMVELSLESETQGQYISVSQTHTSDSITVTATLANNTPSPISTEKNYSLKILIGTTIVSLPIRAYYVAS